MDMTHTPGPWQFDTPDDMHIVSEDYHVIRAGCGFLAEAKDEREPGFRIAGHMTVADARLIAAAPNLLEALRKIAAANVGEDGCYYTNRANIQIARSAVAAVERAK